MFLKVYLKVIDFDVENKPNSSLFFHSSKRFFTLAKVGFQLNL